MGPEEKQKPDLLALTTIIEETLLPRALSDEWPVDSTVPSVTRSYLQHILHLLSLARKMANSANYMPVEAMQLLVARSPDLASLWIPDPSRQDELWLSTSSDDPLTMTHALGVSSGSHIGFSEEHFFQIAVSRSPVEMLIDKMLSQLAVPTTPPSPILPMEVEAGAILVHPH